jgi:hypothetical protein
MNLRSSVEKASRRAFLLLMPVTLLLAGCASLGGSGEEEEDFDVEQADIATSALPSTQNVSHHPDSLAYLQIVEKDRQIDFQLDGSYADLLKEWTAGRAGRDGRNYFRTHATLWSKELSLASLVPERGIQTLSKDLAREMIEERTASYDSSLQIDVYVFAPSLQRLDLGQLQLGTAGQRVYLRDQDNTRYEPARITSQAPSNAIYIGRETLYVRNMIFFERYAEDGSDLLDAQELRLYVRPDGYYFTWTFPEKTTQEASSRP